jgi:large subunit ribosomal protein L5
MAKEKKIKIETEKKVKSGENPMRKIKLEKLILNCGGTEDKLERSAKLLNILTGRTIKKVASTKRIPTFGVRPGLVTGCLVTIRDEEKEALLKRLFGAIGNKIKAKKICDNHFSFGVKEYLEIPDMEYQRDIGIVGFDVTAVFKRNGKSVGIKKIKQGHVPKKQDVKKEEIIEYLQTKLGINVE